MDGSRHDLCITPPQVGAGPVLVVWWASGAAGRHCQAVTAKARVIFVGSFSVCGQT